MGRYIVDALVARGDDVRVLGRHRYPELEPLGVELVHTDLRDRAVVRRACRNIEAVFHVAALAAAWGTREEFYSINVEGTDHVLAGCREQGVPKLVFTSTPSVVCADADLCHVDETCPYPARFTAWYPATKALAEQRVLAANGRDGLLTTVLRPHLIWGPRDPHLVPRILERARARTLFIVGDGSNLVDITYVENAAEAHLQAADHLVRGSPVAGQTYFISQGEPVLLWGFINEILERLGLPRVSRSVPYGLAKSLGATLELAYRVFSLPGEPRLTRWLATGLARSHYFDISRARRDFGYAPRVSTQEGLERLIASLAPDEMATPRPPPARAMRPTALPLPSRRTIGLAAGLALAVAGWAAGAPPPDAACASSDTRLPFTLSGYVKSLNLWTRSTGNNPEVADNALAANEGGEDLFATINRLRVKLRWPMGEHLSATLDYDQEAQFGSLVGRGDARILRDQREQRQLVDLRQTLVDEGGALYEHGLYRAWLSARAGWLEADIGRQQIPWGVGRFVAPTDVFNPFDFTQLEVEERDGVDAVNLRATFEDVARLNLICTPRGERLHPNRLMARLSRDVFGYETAILGGRVRRNNVIGFDLEGHIGQGALRAEALFEDAAQRHDFGRATVNADYQFTNGLYTLLEYHFNGQGRSNQASYERTEVIRGQLQRLAKHYAGLELGYDITPNMRIESRSVLNLQDHGVFSRLELRNILTNNLVLTLSAIGVFANATDEFGAKEHAYYVELQHFF